jgi:cell division protein FtsL
MNAAGRLMNQGVLSRGWVVSIVFHRTQMPLVCVVFAALVSALSIVYVTNSSRGLNADLQQALLERQQMHVQWGQLLLEKSTWIMQARIQNVAEDKLDMVMPNNKSVVVVNE